MASLVYSVCASPVFIKNVLTHLLNMLNMLLYLAKLWARRACGQFLTGNVGTKPATQHASALTMGSWTLSAPQHTFTQFPWLHFYSKKPAMFVKNIIMLQWSQICNNPRCVFMSHRELAVTTYLYSGIFISRPQDCCVLQFIWHGELIRVLGCSVGNQCGTRDVQPFTRTVYLWYYSVII